jgi:hypothetical protein
MYPLVRRSRLFLAFLLTLCSASANQPEADPQHLNESGQVTVAGQTLPYLIRRLPISSFPDLPAHVADQLNQRQCLIPQSYEAHHPENVVRASLERAGSSDWAVLCSANGTVSLLVFFGSTPGKPAVLATTPEKERLQRHDSSGVLGFDWAIDPASPDDVHQAQSAMARKPPRLDHDALKDITLDRTPVYRFFSKGVWRLLDTTG